MQKCLAEAKPTAPQDPNRSPRFPLQTRPRRTQCGVGADDSFVTNAECARTRIPDRTTTRSRPRAPLSISGLSCFLLLTSLCSRQREVSAAPHRGNANRPLTIQGKAKAPGTLTNRRRAGNQNHAVAKDKPGYKTLAISDKTIDSTSVDINGNGYSRPKRRKVTSPGIRPMPIFLSHGQQADNTATAINVVNSQRIIANP